ncbi:MAG: methyltransferase domain-containing protein [Acidobacteria bacterium]|jgi:SAM-dependent methyltransferase|nr:MAG: methyltransferase domain-containing protein [Acidobacteriota bacterium]GIU81091.1 MAG: methyltransferase [Pyrinomonadaceae bacterium]
MQTKEDFDLINILRCPNCKSELTKDLECKKCSVKYPVIRGIPRFVNSEFYVENFGFQWNKHKRTQFDNEKEKPSENFLRQIGLTPELVEGKLVLDAGCGAGRYSDVVSRWGAKVVGVDLSSAVEASYENLSSRGVKIIQADIMNLPFAEETFDVIFSIGVLHHTPNTRKAFEALIPFLKPGGFIVIWLYHAYNDDTTRMKLSKFYRRFSWKLPKKVLYGISWMAVPYYYLNRVPILRVFTGRLWHIAEHKNWKWRVLDTFDWYSPKYQWHHTYPEVFQWFEENGLTNIRVSEPPVTVSGFKRK